MRLKSFLALLFILHFCAVARACVESITLLELVLRLCSTRRTQTPSRGSVLPEPPLEPTLRGALSHHVKA